MSPRAATDGGLFSNLLTACVMSDTCSFSMAVTYSCTGFLQTNMGLGQHSMHTCVVLHTDEHTTLSCEVHTCHQQCNFTPPKQTFGVLQLLHLIISNHKCYTRLPKLLKLRNHASHCLFALRFHMMMLRLQHRTVTIGATCTPFLSRSHACSFVHTTQFRTTR